MLPSCSSGDDPTVRSKAKSAENIALGVDLDGGTTHCGENGIRGMEAAAVSEDRELGVKKTLVQRGRDETTHGSRGRIIFGCDKGLQETAIRDIGWCTRSE